MVKTLRRTCDNPLCEKLYRYSSAASKYCSRACRDKVYRERKAEKDKAASEARWAKLREFARQIDAQIEPEPDSPARPARREPKPISRLFPEPAEKPAVITIHNVPTRFPGTPLPRRY